jgi:hypothetical protein
MHVLALFLISTVTVSAVSVKALAIAVAIYPILQMVKKLFPALNGHYALGVNIGLAMLGFIITVPAGDLLTVSTLVGVLTSVSAAAGIHGTVQNVVMPLMNPQPAVVAVPPSGQTNG